MSESGKWLIEVRGEEFDLRELKDLNSLPNIDVIDAEGRYFVSSTKFDSMTDPNEVEAAGRELVNTLNGIAALAFDNWERVEWGGLTYRNPDGTRKILLSGTVRGRSRVKGSFTVTRADGTVEKPARSGFESFTELSGKDSAVEKAMRIFGSRGHTWTDLYVLYEVVESDMGGTSAIVNNGWASKKAIDRFKHSANSVDTAGDDARHGKETTQPPADPMALKEAQQMVRSLMKKWMASKI